MILDIWKQHLWLDETNFYIDTHDEKVLLPVYL